MREEAHRGLSLGPPWPLHHRTKCRIGTLVLAYQDGSVRAGEWVPARHVWVLNTMGGTELDFREARFGAGGHRGLVSPARASATPSVVVSTWRVPRFPGAHSTFEGVDPISVRNRQRHTASVIDAAVVVPPRLSTRYLLDRDQSGLEKATTCAE